MIRHLLPIAGLAIALLAGCATSAAPSPRAEVRTPGPPIAGTSWRLDRLDGLERDPSGGVAGASDLDAAIADRPPSLRFDGPDRARPDRVSGFAGVNRCSGPVAIGDPGPFGDIPIRFGPLATTRMAGPPERMALEAAFLAMLGEVRVVRTVSGTSGASATLILLGDERLIAIFTAEPDDESAPTTP
jgi:hypothetical protein